MLISAVLFVTSFIQGYENPFLVYGTYNYLKLLGDLPGYLLQGQVGVCIVLLSFIVIFGLLFTSIINREQSRSFVYIIASGFMITGLFLNGDTAEWILDNYYYDRNSYAYPLFSFAKVLYALILLAIRAVEIVLIGKLFALYFMESSVKSNLLSAINKLGSKFLSNSTYKNF